MTRPPLTEIDVSHVQSTEELHAILEDALGFPSFYGRNWNAFWDAITGLVEMPHRLIVRGWANVERKWPQDAEAMAQCLYDLQAEYPADAADFELRA